MSYDLPTSDTVHKVGVTPIEYQPTITGVVSSVVVTPTARVGWVWEVGLELLPRSLSQLFQYSKTRGQGIGVWW